LKPTPKRVVTSDTIIEKKNAGQNPPTANPGTIEAAIMISKALITSENNPRVRIFIGRVSINIIGLINKLITPSTIASMNAPSIVTLTCGTSIEATMMAKTEVIQ